MPKFKMLRDLLVRDGVIREDQIYQPGRPPQAWLELVHKSSYVEAYCEGKLDAKAQRRIGLPWSEGLVRRTCTAVGGTILTAKLALNQGLACNTAGGTHHAFPGYGSGFCIFNDIAIAIRLLKAQNLLSTVLIVDLDVHQGDGTAWIFCHDPSVFTFSMHCAVNFPGRKQTSDLDVSLDEGTEDDEYLAKLEAHLPDLLAQVKPDLVLYDAGADPHRDDRLGKLALTDEGLYRRDRYVLETCAQARCPVACVIGGGYGKDMNALIYRHSYLHRAASEIYQKYC
ncbi:histone deacetylase [Leptolyngbya sp. Heron Island J]|uniref:histone deacetylase family protein n=1 Tax=Leptolyngbya sp. Heron Island J TaxID=1385935 RepID=UPI0003B986D9|nr:histone deacetylase [Leptolyngbya sp. Heron Island J]ESA34795.1 histone deacetylase [Leptolyngbya sp. Heron Island J]